MRYLTKSRFRLAIECPTKLYYTKKDKLYANKKEEDTFLKSLAEGGFQVEELARLHYPGGYLIEDDRNSKSYYTDSLSRTEKLLSKENVIIYEAAFCYQKLFIRADILIKTGNKIKLVEVKAKSFDSSDTNQLVSSKGKINSSWRPYLYDLAFQKHVIKSAYPDWEVSAYLMMADKSKKATINGLNQLFRISDNKKRTGIESMVNSIDQIGKSVLEELAVDEVLALIYEDKDRIIKSMSFIEMIDTFSDYYFHDKKIQWPVGWHCKTCEFKASEKTNENLINGFQECWKEQMNFIDSDFVKPNIFEIWNFRAGPKLLDSGKFFLEDINEQDVGMKTSAIKLTTQHRQWIQVEKTLELKKSGKSNFYLDKENLKIEMKDWVYPLHFIDFETSSSALPFTEGRRPYEQVAFQFSHHIVYQNGEIHHASEYIDLHPGKFPNFDFVRALKKALGNDSGTIFKYAPHENSILNAIYIQLCDSSENDKEVLKEFIRQITNSNNSVADDWVGERDMVDLCDLVKKYFYHPYMKGSNSIKSVLPCVLKISDFLRIKYAKPINDINLTSKNFSLSHIWLNSAEIDPYNSLPDLNLDNMESSISNLNTIKDGGAALTAFGKVQYTNMSEMERELIKKALLKYCELDTLAMVMIWEFFNFECFN